MKSVIADKSIIKLYGHSLGAPHAFYLGGLLIKDGHGVEIVAFEPPRASNEVLDAILAPYPVRCYRNCQDIVTQVPTALNHPREIIQLNCPPVSGDLTPFKYHHSALQVTAMAVAQIMGNL